MIIYVQLIGKWGQANMPFKTKRQKIAAGQKRYTFGNGKVTFAGTSQGTSQELGKIRHVNSVDSWANDDSPENKTLAREIAKIGILSFVIIGLQISLRMAPSSIWLGVFH